jgi:hypothetical protein
MSRCNTPRLCAYSIALQTSMNRRRSFRNSSERRPGFAVSISPVWKRSMDRFSESPLMKRMA